MIENSYPEPHIQNTTKTRIKSKISSKVKKSHRHYDHWFSGPHNSAQGETALWIAVITQAMMDALARSNHAETKYHKHEAIRWLSDNGKDFVQVCLFAGMDPDYVRRKAKRALVKPVSWRAAPGKGKRYHERKTYRERIKDSGKDDRPARHSAKIITGPWLTQ